jgi:hypothetical protein
MKLIMIILAFYGSVSWANINSQDIKNKKLEVGEELRYVVSYAFIKIGEVKIKVKDKHVVNGKEVYEVAAYIDSYPGLPFVDLHQIYESRLMKNYFPSFFRGLVKHKDHTSYTEYHFIYEDNKIEVKKGRYDPDEVWVDSVLTAEKEYQDGLSLFFYARMNSGVEKSVSVPCFVNEEKVYTDITFYKKVTPVEIDAVNYDIACVRLDGRTDFVSIFGLTGYFEGWFTNDEASIPVVARMKVIIGNIKLELVEWKRKDWQPPKFIQ